MLNEVLRALLSVFGVLLVSPNAPGRDLYISPDGTSSGSGTLTEPYDLATALSGQVGQPGDTFWLRGGDYMLGHLNTRIASTPGQTVTFRQMAGEKARIDGSLTFVGTAGHVVFRDFELYSSDTNRLSAQTDVGFDPSDIRPVSGIACYSPNMGFVNLVIHDHTRHGIYISENATNTFVYGCLVYNNGWASPNNAEGHNLYVQGNRGTREIADNVAFNCTGANFHIYENAGGRQLVGVTLDGNVAFNAGALQGVRRYRDWIVGVDPPAISADRIVFKNNMGFSPLESAALDQVQIGRGGVNGSVAVLNNYLPQSLLMSNWSIAAVAGNLFVAQTNWIVSLNQTQVPLAAAWDDNRYWRLQAGRDFQSNAVQYGFYEWQQATGYDTHSTYTVGAPSGTQVFVRPNRYEPGRANIIVYNWDNWDAVSVDVSSVLASGVAYEVRDVQDWSAPPVLSGVFDGAPLSLPVTGLTVAAPNGPLRTPPPTGPTFNVFVLLPRLVRLGATALDDRARVFWPTSSGYWVLQSTERLSPFSVWTDDTNSPIVFGGQFVVTNLHLQDTRFYRLRAAGSASIVPGAGRRFRLTGTSTGRPD